jgi:hypothetical protein
MCQDIITSAARNIGCSAKGSPLRTAPRTATASKVSADQETALLSV